MSPDGLTTCVSGYGPKETMDRLVAAVTHHGMTILARIDHASAAIARNVRRPASTAAMAPFPRGLAAARSPEPRVLIPRPPPTSRRRLWHVPEGRRIFANLTVEENLKVPLERAGPWTIARVFELFPRLAERRTNKGRQLSGGEQEMLAIARALLLNPRLIILDEPSQGLAPLIVQEVFKVVVAGARRGHLGAAGRAERARGGRDRRSRLRPGRRPRGLRRRRRRVRQGRGTRPRARRRQRREVGRTTRCSNVGSSKCRVGGQFARAVAGGMGAGELQIAAGRSRASDR